MNTVVINYVSCNWDSILFISFIIPAVICLIIFIKVISYSEYYNSQNILVPMFYYFGDTSIVKNRVEHIVDIIKSKGRRPIPLSPTSSSPVVENMEVIHNDFVQEKCFVLSNIFTPFFQIWRFFVRIITRIINNGIKINSQVISIHETSREKILADSANINRKIFIDFLEPAWRKYGKP